MTYVMPDVGLSPAERRQHGVIVTARDQQTGERRTVHRAGDTTTRCLAAACAEVVSWGPQWMVATVSTPRSIFRDLQGTRRTLGRQEEPWWERVDKKDQYKDDPRRYEIFLLGRAGFPKLLEPLRRDYSVERGDRTVA